MSNQKIQHDKNDIDPAEADRVVPCPACDAIGKMLATGIRYAEGHTGPYYKMLPCPDCGGQKTILAIRLEWIERGEEIRRWRRANELTLHDVAERSGLRPSEVSFLESGRVDNTNWRALMKVDQNT